MDTRLRCVFAEAPEQESGALPTTPVSPGGHCEQHNVVGDCLSVCVSVYVYLSFSMVSTAFIFGEKYLYRIVRVSTHLRVSAHPPFFDDPMAWWVPHIHIHSGGFFM